MSNADRSTGEPSARVPLPNPVVSAPSTLFRTTSGECRFEVSAFLNPTDFNVSWSICLDPLEAAILLALHFRSSPPTLQELRSLLTGFSEAQLEPLEAVVDRLRETGILLGTPEARRDMANEDCLASTRRLRRHLADQIRSRTSAVLREKLSRWRTERPFYGEKLAAVDLTSLSLDDLASVPVLSKEEARVNVPGILAPDLAISEVEWRGSSGTTDDRFQAAHDSSCRNPWSGEARAINRHYRVYPSSVLTTPVCSGTECHADMELPFAKRRSPVGDGIGFFYFFFNSGMNPTAFPEAKLRQIYDELMQHRPRRMTVNAAYLAAFVYWARRLGLPPPNIDVVWAGFEVPSKIHKKAIEEYFQRRVFEAYGLTEAGGELAIECEAGGNLHFVPWEYLFEVLDEHGQPVKDGETGTVHLTTLKKEFTPLVRYGTGDRGIARSACPCGCPLPAMGLVEGRRKDVIHATDGQPIYPRQLDRHVSEVASGIGWYQLQQTGEHQYHLWIVPEGELGTRERGAVEGCLRSLLGAGAKLTISTTRTLSPSLSGKFRLCYRTDDPQ